MGTVVKERVIGNFTYRVRQHGYREGRALLPVVLRAAGPGLAALVSGMGAGEGKGMDATVDISGAIAEFTSALSAEDLAHITDKLAERSWILNGAQYQYLCDPKGNTLLSNVEEEHWPERYGDWAQWVYFALEVNFGSFLGGNGSLGKTLSSIVKGASASTSPSTSTGDSGGS